MWQLMLKDIYLNKKYLIMFAAAGTVMALLFRSNSENNSVLFVMGIVFSLTSTIRSAAQDGIMHSYSFLASLPIQKAQIVYSKFLYSFVFTLGTYAVASIFIFLLIPDVGLEEILPYSLGYSFILIIQGVFWMLVFKLGHIQATTYIRYLMLLPLLPILFIKQLSPTIGQSLTANSILSVVPVVLFIAVVIYFLLAKISSSIFKMQDIAS